jgi:hypothetical protein
VRPCLLLLTYLPDYLLTYLGAALAFFTAYLVLKIKTDRNHDNLTNEELDWKRELGKEQKTFLV